jgi:hypothetical protein
MISPGSGYWVIWFISVRLDKGTESRGSHTLTKFKGAYRLCAVGQGAGVTVTIADRNRRDDFTRFGDICGTITDGPGICHQCNTAAAIAFPEFSADMIRLGIGLYGLYPSASIKELNLVDLTPSLMHGRQRNVLIF